MDYLAGGVEAVLRDAGVQRAVLVGHSMGTPVIRQFYRRHPAEVVALVVVDGPLRSIFKDTVQADSLVERLGGTGYQTTMAGLMGNMLNTMSDSAAKARVMHVALTTSQEVAVGAMRGMADPAIWGNDQIRVPMLAVMATRDGWTADYVAYAKHLVPKIRYVSIRDVGHFLMIERPVEFNALLASFLRQEGVIH
jgi:pimeloyl-ACP methyl ester carboxylesterase